jgi:Flp pilus assembly protein CpaB
VNRFGVVERVREQWLAATGLALALLALVLGLSPAGGGASSTTVLALRHAVPAGGIVRPSDVVSVPIAAADRTPSMVSRLDALAGRRTLIELAGGDFVLRGALSTQDAPSLLRRGERAVALELAPGSAPDSSLLRRGRFVDVVVGSRVAARRLQLLSPASERSGGISVTVRAPAAVALALATARRGGELRLLLRSAGA